MLELLELVNRHTELKLELRFPGKNIWIWWNGDGHDHVWCSRNSKLRQKRVQSFVGIWGWAKMFQNVKQWRVKVKTNFCVLVLIVLDVTGVGFCSIWWCRRCWESATHLSNARDSYSWRFQKVNVLEREPNAQFWWLFDILFNLPKTCPAAICW